MKKHSLQELVLGSESWVGLKKTTGPSYRVNEAILWADASYNLYLTPGDGSPARLIVAGEDYYFEAGAGTNSVMQKDTGNTADGDFCFVFGDDNAADSDRTQIFGDTNYSTSNYTNIFGVNNSLYDCVGVSLLGDSNKIDSAAFSLFIGGANSSSGGTYCSLFGENNFFDVGSLAIGLYGSFNQIGENVRYTNIFGTNNIITSISIGTLTAAAGNSGGSYTIVVKEAIPSIPVVGRLFTPDGYDYRYVGYSGNTFYLEYPSLYLTLDEDDVITVTTAAEESLFIGHFINTVSSQSIILGAMNESSGYLSFVQGVDNEIGTGAINTVIRGGMFRLAGYEKNIVGASNNLILGTYVFGSDNEIDSVGGGVTGLTSVWGMDNLVGTVASTQAIFVFGGGNQVDAAFFSLAFGSSNIINQSGTSIPVCSHVFGDNNECYSGYTLMSCEGSLAESTANYSAIIASSGASTTWPYSIVHASDVWAGQNPGDQQVVIDVPLWGETNDVITWTELAIGNSDSLVIEDYSVYQLHAMILASAVDDVQHCKSFELTGMINNYGGVITVIGSNKTVISTTADFGEETWDVRLTADSYTGAMKIESIGECGVGGTVRWYVSLKCIKQTTEAPS